MSGIGSSAVTSGTESPGTGGGVIGTSLEMGGPSQRGSRDAPGGQRSKYACSPVSRRESSRSYHGSCSSKANVVSSCLHNSIAMTDPHVCKTFMSNDNSRTQPTHRPLTFWLFVSTPIHDVVSNCKSGSATVHYLHFELGPETHD